VSDETGDVLPGASVVVIGTNIGTTTDASGRFTLNNVTEDAVLRISFVGYDNQTVTVGSQRTIDVTMFSGTSFDELVVIGYGIQRKSLVSGAISRVTAEDLEQSFPTRLEDVLNGRVSGLAVMSDNGQPNSGSAVFVRGIGTVENANPLFIVDGVQIDGVINFLNPADIASVEVLKDAASAAIYGTRGANGVIIITTKQGQKGRASVSYDFNMGWQNPWKKVEVLNAQQYMTLMNEMQVNDGASIRYTAAQIANAQTTDWQDAIFNKNAPIVNHNVSVSGGSDNNTYSISYSYLKHDGIVGGNFGKSNLDRHTLRLNNVYTAFKTDSRSILNNLDVGLTANYTRRKNVGIEANAEWGAPLTNALQGVPYQPIYASDDDLATGRYPAHAVRDKDGRIYSLSPTGSMVSRANPVAMLDNRRVFRTDYEDVVVGGVWAQIQIMPGLRYMSSYSADMSFWGHDGYNLTYYLATQNNSIDTNDDANVYGARNRRLYWQVENYFSYDNQFGLHGIELMVGQSASKSNTNRISGSRRSPNFEDHDKMFIGNTRPDPTLYWITGDSGSSNVNFYALASYFGRLNYNYDQRYILSASLRRDGSSRFGPDNKWGIFPAVSLAWNIHNEPYMQDYIPFWLSAAKVRVSWGRNGNDRIGELRYQTNYSSGGAYDYYFGGGYTNAGSGSWNGTIVQGLQPGALENRLLKWEQSEQTNFGIDFAFFRNALTISADYFTKATNGMLQTAILPPSTGQSAPIANVGDMSNKGVEFDISYRGRQGDFFWNTSLNASYVKTTLVHYGNATGIQYSMESNGPTGTGEFMRGSNGDVYPYFYGLQTNGIFQNWAEVNAHTFFDESGVEHLLQPDAMPGDIRFVSLTGDAPISNDDKTKIGKPMPDWEFGFSLGGGWKGFDVNLFFKSAIGFDIYNMTQRGDIPAINRPAWVLNRWHGEGTSNTVPRMTAVNDNGNYNSSDLYLEKGNYLRLKTAQIGYTLPTELTQRVAIQRLRLYVSAHNLLTFTKYRGFEVEIGSRSVDRGVYPQARTIAVGANLVF
jgi:TonB-linked SusC/RagA family outer membrane protein